MISDEVYECCLPVLQDEKLEDEDKTEKLEELLRKETPLTGKQLENAVLDTLWRFRDSGTPNSSSKISRHTIIRRPSPAPWQTNLRPSSVTSSPKMAPSSVLSATASSFTKAKSTTISPFPSPRPSPRLAFASTQLSRSPDSGTYDVGGTNGPVDIFGDYWNDPAEWQANDEVGSHASSSYLSDGGYKGGTSDNSQMQMGEMSPYDMLRSILRDERSNEEIEKALEANNYDLSATIYALMDGQTVDLQRDSTLFQEQNSRIVVGKSVSPSFRPATPVGQVKSSIMCKYWLSNGNCARADCRFSHDPSKTVCKYVDSLS